ncbi:interferon-induced protein 44-like [Gadus chalcogrammus]|uniref:interferon-induced protein 44-like n=1 Tax=Gadus chalcogrammus TaxID=1042646 RepID=UPI0024C42E70|nr:interferon-induced protein 44-like [Gadus chalcogrammus]
MEELLWMFLGTPGPAIEKPKPLKEAWRIINWGDREKELGWLNLFALKKDTKKHLRILLYGPAGSGKSSFINSVDSVCQNRITCSAPAFFNGISFTVTYKTYQIEKEVEGQYHPFVFNDVMGLESKGGVCEEDIKHAMQGHLKEGYKFNAASAFCPSDERLNKKPDINDKADILVCVVRADTGTLLKNDTLAKMKLITVAARDYGIPQMAILTAIDEACPLVKESIQNVYKSEHIKRMMKHLQSQLGIPLTNIFPVKNYHEEIALNADIDMLILSALRQIIQIAKDQVKRAQKEGVVD